MSEPTRVEAGRRRAQAAKRVVALAAATSFAVALALVRLGHPATATSVPTPARSQAGGSSPSSTEDDQRSGSSLGGGSIAPSSGGAAPVATATS
jgi:hypothetical protein